MHLVAVCDGHGGGVSARKNLEGTAWHNALNRDPVKPPAAAHTAVYCASGDAQLSLLKAAKAARVKAISQAADAACAKAANGAVVDSDLARDVTKVLLAVLVRVCVVCRIQ